MNINIIVIIIFLFSFIYIVSPYCLNYYGAVPPPLTQTVALWAPQTFTGTICVHGAIQAAHMPEKLPQSSVSGPIFGLHAAPAKPQISPQLQLPPPPAGAFWIQLVVGAAFPYKVTPLEVIGNTQPAIAPIDVPLFADQPTG